MQMSSLLPEEIIIHILLRLPAKTIGRCRCVSKPWRALLTQPHFIKTHLDRIPNTILQQHSLILLSKFGSPSSVPFTLRNAHQLFDEITEPVTKLIFAGFPDFWTDVFASCNGLVLIESYQDKIFLINPVTRDITQVPPSPFALDPRTSITMYGLGYDSVHGDYKIVTLSYYDTDNEHDPDCTEMFVNVYSVKNGTWKKAESSPHDHAVGLVTSGVFVNGCIHWLAYETTSVIAAFDLTQEKFYEVPPPNSIGEFVLDSLVELGGCLCLSRRTYDSGTDVWVMKEYGNKESWTKFTIIDREGSEFRPLCMLDQEQIVLVKYEEEIYEKLVEYNLENGTFKDIMVDGISEDFGAIRTFIESLVSPHSNH